MFQARLTAANHNGDADKGEQLWREHRSLLPGLRQHGLDGLKLEAELRNRRSISLLDQFRFTEAVEVLRELVNERTNLVINALSSYNQHSGPLDGFADYSLAACLGSLGQALAMCGEQEQAKACFFKALHLFTDTHDRERQWIYLGHLACENRDTTHELWDEVQNALPELGKAEPICGDGNQYKLALQLKAASCFGSVAQVKTLITGFETTLESYSPESREAHP